LITFFKKQTQKKKKKKKKKKEEQIKFANYKKYPITINKTITTKRYHQQKQQH
jgi:hypothetical protein